MIQQSAVKVGPEKPYRLLKVVLHMIASYEVAFTFAGGTKPPGTCCVDGSICAHSRVSALTKSFSGTRELSESVAMSA